MTELRSSYFLEQKFGRKGQSCSPGSFSAWGDAGAAAIHVLVLAALISAVLLAVAAPGRAQLVGGDIPLRADGDVLKQRAFEFWQQVNAARSNPLAVAERLEVPEHVVRHTFRDQPWILEQGLPPLAWNEQLVASVATHGRDMFDRVYYSYFTPEGLSYWDRIEQTGYPLAEAGETMNALFFENFITLDRAFNILLDSMLRDELTDSPSVERNIFNPALTEMGSAFFAESIPLLGDQPYVYLLLADFARSAEPQSYIIGTYPTDCRVVMNPTIKGGWVYVPNDQTSPELPAGIFQVPFPFGGADFVLIDNNGLGAPVGDASVSAAPDDYDESGFLPWNEVNVSIDVGRQAEATERLLR